MAADNEQPVFNAAVVFINVTVMQGRNLLSMFSSPFSSPFSSIFCILVTSVHNWAII